MFNILSALNVEMLTEYGQLYWLGQKKKETHQIDTYTQYTCQKQFTVHWLKWTLNIQAIHMFTVHILHIFNFPTLAQKKRREKYD